MEVEAGDRLERRPVAQTWTGRPGGAAPDTAPWPRPRGRDERSIGREARVVEQPLDDEPSLDDEQSLTLQRRADRRQAVDGAVSASACEPPDDRAV